MTEKKSQTAITKAFESYLETTQRIVEEKFSGDTRKDQITKKIQSIINKKIERVVFLSLGLVAYDEGDSDTHNISSAEVQATWRQYMNTIGIDVQAMVKIAAQDFITAAQTQIEKSFNARLKREVDMVVNDTFCMSWRANDITDKYFKQYTAALEAKFKEVLDTQIEKDLKDLEQVVIELRKG